MTAFEALCTDNFHDYAAYSMSVQQQLSPTVARSPPVGSSFSRLNAAVKPFPFPLAFFMCVRLTWTWRLEGRLLLIAIDSTYTHTHTMLLRATETEMNMGFHSIFYSYMLKSVCTKRILCSFWPRELSRCATMLTIAGSLAIFW